MLEFEKAIKLTGNERKAEIIDRLNDYEGRDLFDICREAMFYDGSFGFCDAFDAEDIGEYVDTSDAYNFMCRIVFGDVDNVNDMFRFNAYGNLESVSEWELHRECQDSIDEIADWLMDNWHNVDSLYNEDEELFYAWEYIDRGVYDWEEEGEEEQQ